MNWALAPRSTKSRNFIFERENLQKIDELIHKFPKEIAIPTTIGAVGVMTLNRAGTHGIHTLELTQNGYYFVHDLNHAIGTTKYPPIWFYNNMEKLSKGLSIKKRKTIQLAYWLITHENTYGENWLSSEKTMKIVLSACAFKTIHDELKGLIDLSSTEIIRLQLEEVIQNFTELFVLAKKKALWR